MAESSNALAIIPAAERVVASLKELKSLQKFDLTIVQEIDQFITSLNENMELLQSHLPNKSGSWALQSLQTDLDKTREELDEGLKSGDSAKFRDAKQVKDKLDRLRQNLINNFQVKLLITSLKVAISADEKMDNFESRMLELSALSAAQNPAAITEIRKLLQPLGLGMTRPDQGFQSFLSMARGYEVNVETSSETQKFLEDVLANLKDLTEEGPSVRPRATEDDRNDYLDPITKQLMNDPVKCTDGLTYDRFSVFEYNLRTRKEPLVIACQDMNVRRKLFEKFGKDGVKTNLRNLRKSYRDEALALANEGIKGHGMLKNVLQWAPNDKKCLAMKDRLEHEIATQQKPVPSVPAGNRSKRECGQENRQPQNSQSEEQEDRDYMELLCNLFELSEEQEELSEEQEEREYMKLMCNLCVAGFPYTLCCLPCIFPGCDCCNIGLPFWKCVDKITTKINRKCLGK